MIGKFGKKKTDIFLKHYYNDRSLRDVGEDYGYGRERIRQNCERSLVKVRSMIEKEIFIGLKEDLLECLA
jgi:DNA-directed RNA polymerase sigma subunit (sigma70/sigma32)